MDSLAAVGISSAPLDTGLHLLCLTGFLENRQRNAMAVRIHSLGCIKMAGVPLGHHEESKNSGSNVPTAIIKPERQAGQVVGVVGSGRAASDLVGGTTWRS